MKARKYHFDIYDFFRASAHSFNWRNAFFVYITLSEIVKSDPLAIFVNIRRFSSKGRTAMLCTVVTVFHNIASWL